MVRSSERLKKPRTRRSRVSRPFSVRVGVRVRVRVRFVNPYYNKLERPVIAWAQVLGSYRYCLGGVS